MCLRRNGAIFNNKDAREIDREGTGALLSIRALKSVHGTHESGLGLSVQRVKELLSDQRDFTKTIVLSSSKLGVVEAISHLSQCRRTLSLLTVCLVRIYFRHDNHQA